MMPFDETTSVVWTEEMCEAWAIARPMIEDGETVAARMRALKALGDPYSDEQIAQAAADVEGKTEMDAVVAYLQGLGRHAPRGGQP